MDIKDGEGLQKRGRFFKMQSRRCDQDDVNTIKSISGAWKEIKCGKGRKANISKFFVDFSEW